MLEIINTCLELGMTDSEIDRMVDTYCQIKFGHSLEELEDFINYTENFS